MICQVDIAILGWTKATNIYLAFLFCFIIFSASPLSFAIFKRHSFCFHKLIGPCGSVLDALGVEEACIFGIRSLRPTSVQ